MIASLLGVGTIKQGGCQPLQRTTHLTAFPRVSQPFGCMLGIFNKVLQSQKAPNAMANQHSLGSTRVYRVVKSCSAYLTSSAAKETTPVDGHGSLDNTTFCPRVGVHVSLAVSAPSRPDSLQSDPRHAANLWSRKKAPKFQASKCYCRA